MTAWAHAKKWGVESVFEVGCGAGANLYLFAQDGFTIGGMDYSSALVDICRHVFQRGNYALKECICDEAIHLPTDIVYDAVFANSVFSYFPSDDYALAVLERMLKKTRRSIALIDLHDKKKEADFLKMRHEMIEDYDQKYAGLDKHFYDKAFFVEFARSHGLAIRIDTPQMEGYWNSLYVFDVYMTHQ